MSKKYYVVWKGHKTGIFNTWNECKSQIDGFSGARFKSFSSIQEAELAYQNNPNITLTKPLTNLKKQKTKSSSSSLSQKKIEALPLDIKIFTDGGCEPNPGQAGTGMAVYKNNCLSELWHGLYEPNGTNNTAELHGLNQALRLTKKKLNEGYTVGIFCDSKYSIDCITKWAHGWKKKGWKKANGDIKNLDLIQEIYALYQEISSKVTIHHVNGHIGIEGNELADRMSMIAIDSKIEPFCQYTTTYHVPEILAFRRG